MQVGFIGLGIMGASMAANLQKAGYQLVVHDIRQDSAMPHLKAGAKWADSPKSLAAQSKVVFTSLPGPPEVEAVALGSNGLIEGMEKGSAWFDLTTNSPTLMRRLHQLCSERGLHLLNAPVSGGPRGAKSSRLAIWVWGEGDINAPQNYPPLGANGQPCSPGVPLRRRRCPRDLTSGVRPEKPRECGCKVRGERPRPDRLWCS